MHILSLYCSTYVSIDQCTYVCFCLHILVFIIICILYYIDVTMVSHIGPFAQRREVTPGAYSVSVTLPKLQTCVTEFEPDPDTDLFQVSCTHALIPTLDWKKANTCNCIKHTIHVRMYVCHV